MATQANEGIYAVQNMVDGKLDIWPFNISGLTNRSWNIYTTVTLPQEVEITFFEPVTIAAYELTLHDTTGQAPDDWQMQYWDGAAWVTLDTRVGIIFFNGIPQTFTIAVAGVGDPLPVAHHGPALHPVPHGHAAHVPAGRRRRCVLPRVRLDGPGQ